MPKFSIITVCYNAEKEIEETIKSLIMQDCLDYEYIIKDGGSTDHTLSLAKELLKDTRINYQIYSDKDKGIFDAMNQSIDYATGDYVYFLNSGDRFASADVLSRVAVFIDDQNGGHQNANNQNVEKKKLTHQTKVDIAYGDVYEEFPEKTVCRSYGDHYVKTWYYALGACLNHQTMFCSRELFSDKKFDLEFPVSADRDWQMYHICKKKRIAKAMKFPIAIYLRGGFSEQNVKRLEEDTAICVKRYCGGWNVLYQIIRLIKKNELLHKIITVVEEKVNSKQ